MLNSTALWRGASVFFFTLLMVRNRWWLLSVNLRGGAGDPLVYYGEGGTLGIVIPALSLVAAAFAVAAMLSDGPASDALFAGALSLLAGIGPGAYDGAPYAALFGALAFACELAWNAGRGASNGNSMQRGASLAQGQP